MADASNLRIAAKQIEDRIVNGSDDVFDLHESLMELRVTIRIACEFHDFLLNFGETPSLNEVTYMMDTIRSGMDEFFLLAQGCRVLTDEFAQWNFDRQVLSSSSELRTVSLRRFEALSRTDATAGELLASLLAFVHLQLVFVAQNFPSVMDKVG